MARDRFLKHALLATGMAVFLPTLAQAQDATADTSVDEVVVTAQKREQVLFNVPMAVSAVSGGEIAQRGAQELEDLQYTVPGLSIAQLGPGTERVELRGISVFSGLPTVGVYLDELPLNGETSQSGLDVRLMDMERVEVLRGPQGTLYGQGAVGGTIRYITHAPDLDQVSAALSGEAATIRDGGTDSLVQGAFNLPVVDGVFGIRIAAAHQEYGGWINNTTLGLDDVNSGDSNAIRVTALWRPNDRLDVSLMLSHQDLELGSQNLDDADGEVTSAVTTPAGSDADIVNLTIRYDLGFATLLSSSGLVDRNDFYEYDLSSLFIPALEAPIPFGFGYPPGTFSSIGYISHTGNRFFAQELRLTSTDGGPLSWTVGAMYRDSKTSVSSTTVNTPDIVPVDLLTSTGTSPSDSKSWAVFGEATWQISSTLQATVGGRYFEDSRTQDVSSVTFGTPTADTGKETFSTFSPRLNLMWTPSDSWNFYANVAKGFRSGGFNLVSAGFGVVTVPPTYDPDTLWSYEVGGRYRSPDRRFQAEFAIYYNDWSDVQSLAFATGFPAQYVINGSDIAGLGIDAGMVWRATDALTLTLTGGYNDMTYQNTTGEHVSGDPADYVPRYTAAASANYDFEWAPSVPGFARVDYQVTDGWQVFARNVLPAAVTAEPQKYINIRLGADFGKLSLSAFAKNLTDEDGVTYPAFGALSSPMRPQPRTVGFGLSFKY